MTGQSIDPGLFVTSKKPNLINLSWFWPAALAILACSLIGFSSGVSVTERPELVSASVLTKSYYSLGLFFAGGLDIGVPVGGPLWGRILLWIAYFGAPLLTVSVVVETALNVMAPKRWKLRRLKNHIVIVGSGDMTISYLRVLREYGNTTPVVVVDKQIDAVRELELSTSFNVTVVVGDITHDFLLAELRLKRALRVLLMGSDDFLAYEAASKILRLFPHLESRLIIHSTSLRFLRAMQDTRIAKQSINFNSYNLAAKGLVRDTLTGHFNRTQGKDTVVLAGFGMFGQTILEELQNIAGDHIDFVAIIDLEAERRIQVVDEQQSFTPDYNREILQGDISNPDVWRKLRKVIDLSKGEPVVVLGTGNAGINLRTALWLKQKHPGALVFSRTKDVSRFAQEVGFEHDIKTISITQLVEDNIPVEWLD
jgi:voltage-gated potassium channel Kch